MKLKKKDTETFNMLRDAALNDRLCVMGCTDKRTKKYVAVVCVYIPERDSYRFHPVAKLFGADPFDQLIPPKGMMDVRPKKTKKGKSAR